MKLIIYPFFTLLLFSCNSKKETNDDLKVEITTKEIISKVKPEDKMSMFYHTALLDIADSLPVNKIDFKITNSGKKIYILCLKKNFDNVELTSKKENIQAVVYKNEQIFEPKGFGGAVEWTNKAYNMRKWINETDADSLKKEFSENYLKKKIDFDKIKFERRNNYIIIHPGESKFFTFYRTFPYFLDEDFESRYKYSFNSNERYYFQITIKNNKQLLAETLTENQQKEIKENRYTIFNGKIKSNKIPIKFIQ